MTNQEIVYPPWIIYLAFGLNGVLAAIFAYFLNLYRLKIDNLEKTSVSNERIAKIEIVVAELASRKELIAYMTQIREDRMAMHQENLDNFRELRADVRSVHQRVDEILSK